MDANLEMNISCLTLGQTDSLINYYVDRKLEILEKIIEDVK